MPITDPRQEAARRFHDVFGGAAPLLAEAPGRVNLMGEHTDYNEGFVLPMGIERHAVVAFRARGDGRLRATSSAFGETREVELGGLAPGGGGGHWMDYVAGVAWALLESGRGVGGADLAIAGDVPIGSGLSSSAALEVAVARALCAASSLPWDAVEMARLCQRAENAYVGMACGVMDQFAAAASVQGHALLLDCRSLQTEAVALPAAVAVVVMDTGVRRSLARSAYNERRRSCEEAVAALREVVPSLRALRDVTPALLEAERARLDPVAFKRAAHIVVDNFRPVQMAAALRGGDLASAGRLMNESHASLRDLYEVSCAELDAMVELAQAQPGCIGARMTGAGFGGCAVALVESDRAGDFTRDVERAYLQRYDLPAALFTCRPAAGARLVD